MTERDAADRKEAHELAQAISRYLNVYGESRLPMLVEELGRDHRTLQQKFTRVCMMWMEHLAKSDYDMRNEASVMLARKIMALPARDRALPFI
jgi:hypothetical protein